MRRFGFLVGCVELSSGELSSEVETPGESVDESVAKRRLAMSAACSVEERSRCVLLR